MRAMIFAAGLGTRLKPLTDTMPKALVPLAGKPLLQWQVEKLRDAGITDIIVNVHHFPDQIIEAVRKNQGWGCNITISDERDQLLDTGGGLRKALHLTQYTLHNTPILACNVDILSNIDIKALVAAYAQTGVSQLVVSDRQTQRYLLFDEQGRLQGWTNIATGEMKPSGFLSHKGNDYFRIQDSGFRKLAFSGMQILSPEVLNRLNEIPEAKFSLIDFYLHLCEQNLTPYTLHPTPLMAYVPDHYRMMDVGKIDQIEEAERFAESL